MNINKITKGFVIAASLFFAGSAFAGEKASVRVYEDVKVNGKTIPAGNYQLTWEGTGSNVQVNIQKGKDIVATVPAAVETAKSSAETTGYSTRRADDGSKTITNVFFAGKKYSLNLDQQSAAGSAQSAGTPGNN
jgi:hypothetical protein